MKKLFFTLLATVWCLLSAAQTRSYADNASGTFVVVGVHDFTGNRVPDLVVARRDNSQVGLTLYTLSGGRWVFAASINPIQGKEIRVFRQVVSIREGETLHSWTWHGNGFDYKRSR